MAQATDAVWLPVLPDMSGFGKGIVAGAGKEADKSGKDVGGRFGKAMLAGVAVVAGGAALAAKSLYSIGETFDDVTDTIRVGTGATGADLDALVDSAKTIGRTVPAEFDAIGTAVADLNTRLGLSGPVLETVASQVLELGRITGEEVDINGLSGAFKQFKIEGEATTGALDHLYRVSQATGIGVNDLAAQAAAAAPTMNTLGFSFEETTALIGNLDKAGLNSTQVMKGMQTGMVNLAKDGEAPADAFKRVVGEIGGFIAAGDEAAAIDLAGQAFGTRGAPAMVAALREGTLSLEDMGAVAGMTGDTILGAGEETMDFAEQWQLFKNNILTQIEPIATRVFTALGDGMTWVKDVGVPAFSAFADQVRDRLEPALTNVGNFVRDTLIPGFRDFVGWLKENQAWLIPIAAGIGAMVAAWGAYQATMAIVRGVTVAYTAVQTALNAVMAMNPIALVVLALVGLVAAFVTAYQKSETFRAIVDAAWQGIKNAANAVWTFLRDVVFKGLTDGFKAVADWFSQRWLDIQRYWEGGKAALKAGWDWIDRNVFQLFRNGIQAVADWFGNRVADVKGAWDSIKGAFRAVWDWIDVNVFQNFKAGLDILEGWVRDGVDRIGEGFRRIANFFRDPINWVINFVWNDGLKVAFDNVAKAIGVGTRLPKAPNIPAFAKGGRADRGLALVGEEGPELVDFRTPGRVYTASQTQKMLAAKNRDPSLAAQLDGGIGDVVGAVVGWVRGGLASAADALLSPLKTLIRNTVGRWGDVGRLGGDVAINAMNRLTDWIRGKDKVEEAPGLPAGAPGRAIPGAVPYMNTLAHQLARAAGNPSMTMIARTRSMVGDHKWGGAVDFHSTPAQMNAVANLAAGKRGVRVVLYNRRMWVAGSGWGPQPRSYGGGDPWHTSHAHVGLQRAAAKYDDGGFITPGMSMVANATRKPEPVLTSGQWADIHRLATANAAGGGPQRVWNVTNMNMGPTADEVLAAAEWRERTGAL